jgi:exosortase/archaeosortase family protein
VAPPGGGDVLAGAGASGLVSAFLGAYLWLFRRHLRFPHGLALLPLGIALVWLGNAVCIALLVVIGVSGWPDVAVGGFHSQAGWVTFLAISLGLVAVSPRLLPAAPTRPALALWKDPTSAYLDPFLALLVVSMLTAAFASTPEQLKGPSSPTPLPMACWRLMPSARGAGEPGPELVRSGKGLFSL